MAWLRQHQQPAAAPAGSSWQRRLARVHGRAALLVALLQLGLILEPQCRIAAVARRPAVPLLGAADDGVSGAQRGLLQADADAVTAAGVDAAAVAAAAGYPTAGAVLVTTAAQLVAAIADPAVQVAVLASSVALTEADWAPVAQPVVEVERNLTLLGAYITPAAWPILNLGYTANVDGVGIVREAKVRVGPGCALTFQHLVLTDGRELPQFLFMGLDVFAESPAPNSSVASAWPIVLVHEAALWQRSCLPLSVKGLPGRSIPRPAFLPGAQNSTGTSVPRPPDCVDDPSAPPMTRCWPARGVYRNMAVYAYDADAYDRQTPAGYAMQLVNATFWCDILMTDECVASNGGYLACYYSLFPYSRKAPQRSPPPATTENITTATFVAGAQSTSAGAAGDSGGGSSDSASILAPVLCGVLAGLAGLAMGAGLVAAFVVDRRRRAQQQREKQSSGESAASTPVRQLLLTEAGLGGGSPGPPAAAAAATGISSGGSHGLPESSLAANNKCSNAGASGKLAFRSATGSEALSMLMSAGTYGSHLLDSSGRAAAAASPGMHQNGGLAAGTCGGDQNSGTLFMCNIAMQTAHTIEPIEEDERALVPVTPLTPFQSHIPLDVKLGSGGGEVRLLPVTLGKGACGRVVEGVWDGRRVAVKLLHRGLFNAAAVAYGGPGLGEMTEGVQSPAAGAHAMRPGEPVTPTPGGRAHGIVRDDGQAASAEANGGLLSVGVLSRVVADKRTGQAAAIASGSGASTNFTIGESCMQPSVVDDSNATQPVAVPVPAALRAVGASEAVGTVAPGPAEAALLALAAAEVPAALSMAPWWLATESFDELMNAGATLQQAPQQANEDCNARGDGALGASPKAHAAAAPEQNAAPAAATPAPAEQERREQQLSSSDGEAEAAAAAPAAAPAAAIAPAVAKPLALASIRMGGSSVLDPPNAGSDVPAACKAAQQPRLDQPLLSHTAPESLLSISILADGEPGSAAYPATGTRHKQPLPPVAEAGPTDIASTNTISDMGPVAASAVTGTGAAAEDAAASMEVPEASTLHAASSQKAAARLQAAAAARQRQPLTHGGAVRRTMAQEVEVLARLQHANIVQLLAANLNPACPCLVVELMDTSLDKLLRGDGSCNPAPAHDAAGGSPSQPPALLPLPKVLHIALQVARALAYMHPTIIHRDLKPANVLISDPASAAPVVKIADFGLSRLQDTVLITAHVDVGTAPYMAPEALDARNCIITHHSDMYSYGIMLYEMLAGARPWRGLNMLQIAVAVCEKQQRPRLEDLSEARCPPAVRALVSQCWDPVPERRPSAAEVAKQLAIMMQQQMQQ